MVLVPGSGLCVGSSLPSALERRDQTSPWPTAWGNMDGERGGIVAGSPQSPLAPADTAWGSPSQGVKNRLHRGAESTPKAGSPLVPRGLCRHQRPPALGLQCRREPPCSTSCRVNTGIGQIPWLSVPGKFQSVFGASLQRWSLGRGEGHGGGSGALTQGPRFTIRTGTF